MIRRHPMTRDLGPMSASPPPETPSAPPAETLGDRLEHAIEARTAVQPEAKPRANLRRSIFWLAVTGVSLYLVFPSIVDVFSSYRDITRFSIGSLAAMAALQVGS